MPKKRQIPFLRERRLADGSRQFDWKPSNQLRDMGWPHVTLGGDEADAIRQALEINARLAEWRKGNTAGPQDRARDDGPRLVRWDGLITRYRKARDYTGLKPSTRKEYDSRIRWLTGWALDGQLVVRQIDHGMVLDLKRALEQAGSSDHRTAAMMRVLRLLLSFAEREGIIPHGSNPANRAKIREPKSRRHVLSIEAVEALAIRAGEKGWPAMALAIRLGFWTLQRESDLLGNFNRFGWREFHDVDTRDAATLSDVRGKVWGFRFQQEKTGAWVDCPVPPALHAAVAAAWNGAAITGDPLLRDDTAPEKPLAPWRLQRQWRELRDACAQAARSAGRLLLADECATAQFRDLRRSGMVFMRDCGAKKEWITSLSGHAVLAKKSILDTYMPADTAAACAAQAQALRHYNRQKKEKTG